MTSPSSRSRFVPAALLGLAVTLGACSGVDMDGVAPESVYAADTTSTSVTASGDASTTTSEPAGSTTTEAAESTTTSEAAESTTTSAAESTTTSEATAATVEGTSTVPTTEAATTATTTAADLEELPHTGPDEVLLLIAVGCAILVAGRTLVDMANAANQRLLHPIRRARPMPPR